MKRLDKVGLDYLILMAKDIGFKPLAIDTKESENCSPQVTITFEQTRELIVAAPVLSPPSVAAGYTSSVSDITSGAIGAGLRSGNRSSVFSALDDVGDPPCSTSKS